MLGRNLSTFNLNAAQLEVVKTGLVDQALGNKPKVDLQVYAAKVGEMAQTRQATAARVEKEKGKAYADTIAKQPGAQRMSSGLIYIPIKEGKGESPKVTDVVKVHYHGTLVDGSVFDSSVERKEPAEFALNRVVPCWAEGLQKMKPGGKAKLVCPASLAYGEAPRPKIPSGSTLIFEVELLEIKSSSQDGKALPDSKH
jgi:FKBP-type peptidyl-prolyl cis-trans isomerase